MRAASQAIARDHLHPRGGLGGPYPDRGRWLWIDGYVTDPRTFEVVRLGGDDDVDTALDLPELVIRRMYDQARPDPLRPPG